MYIYMTKIKKETSFLRSLQRFTPWRRC